MRLTLLRLVNASELRALRARGGRWEVMDRLLRRLPGDHVHLTPNPRSLNYFVTGRARPRPSPSRPLTGMMYGFSRLPCPTLQIGRLDLVARHQVRSVLDGLTSLDLDAIRRRVEHAAPAALADRGVDDYEHLLGQDLPPAAMVARELKNLTSLYRIAALGRYAVVSYTTPAR